VVKIAGPTSVTIKELTQAAKKTAPEIANKYYYPAQIVEIINKGESLREHEESWTILFSPRENAILKKIKKSGVGNIDVNDTIFIMDREDLSYSMIYYVEGRHKIFSYYYCTDAASEIKAGESYIFISNGVPSHKNGVFYGNVDFGLYPDTKEMRAKIASILENRY